MPEFCDSTRILNWVASFHIFQFHHSHVLNLSYWISASFWSLPTLLFGRVCLAYTGSNWKPRILEKLSKLWHGKSCFAFRKKSSGFLWFFILFSCSMWLFKVWLKHSQDAHIFFVFFYFQVACNCSNYWNKNLNILIITSQSKEKNTN